MALLGGPYRVAGPVLGALVLAVVSEVLLVEFRYVYLIFLGSLLIATVRYMPHGLAGAFVWLGQYWGRGRLACGEGWVNRAYTILAFTPRR